MEIVYCAGCQSRVTGSDLEQGRAFRSGDRVLCRDCAPAELAVAASRASAASRPASSTTLPRMGTTRRTAAPAPPPKSRALLIGGGLAAAGLVLLVVALSGRPDPVPAAPPPTPASLPAAPAPPVRDTGAEKKRASEWSSLETQVKQASEKEEFGRAVGLLEAALKGASEPDWDWMVQKKMSEIRDRAKALCADLQSKALAARDKGADAEVQAFVGRVAAWKLAGCALVLPEKPAPPLPAPPPPAPVEKGPAVVVYDDRLAPGWSNWSYSVKLNLEATDQVAEGSRAISVSFDRNGAGMYFHTNKFLEGSKFTTLEFSCRAEGENTSLFLSLSDENKKSLGSLSFSKIGGHPPTGEWKRYVVPISLLNAEGKLISGLTIQSAGSKIPGTPVYFDTIVFK